MEIILTKTERALSLTQIDLADYVINPYKGCQVGCLYCYARSNRGILKITKEWGEYVYVKERFVEKLEQQIEAAGPISRVLVGSTTESLQPVEEDYEITKGIFSLLKKRNIPFVLLTKSAKIREYLSLLTYSPRNRVYITINSPEVRELFEKRSSPQEERIAALAELHRAGVNTRAYISPLFPGLTDGEAILEKLAGKTERVSFESYSKKLGNWKDIAPLLPGQGLKELESAYATEESYNSYWSRFREKMELKNRGYGFKLDFFIYPFDAYYGQDKDTSK